MRNESYSEEVVWLHDVDDVQDERVGDLDRRVEVSGGEWRLSEWEVD